MKNNIIDKICDLTSRLDGKFIMVTLISPDARSTRLLRIGFHFRWITVIKWEYREREQFEKFMCMLGFYPGW